MVNEQFIHLLPPPASKWAKAKTVALWTLYCMVAFVVSWFVLIGTGNFWHSFATIAAFIFGPKLWRAFS